MKKGVIVFGILFLCVIVLFVQKLVTNENVVYDASKNVIRTERPECANKESNNVSKNDITCLSSENSIPTELSESVNGQPMQITEMSTLPPEYNKCYEKIVLDSEGKLKKEFLDEIVQINYWVGDTLYSIRDENIVNQIKDHFSSIHYQEIEETQLIMGGQRLDLITNNNECLTLNMLTDRIFFQGKRYSVDKHIIEPIRELVYQ